MSLELNLISKFNRLFVIYIYSSCFFISTVVVRHNSNFYSYQRHHLYQNHVKHFMWTSTWVVHASSMYLASIDRCLGLKKGFAWHASV